MWSWFPIILIIEPMNLGAIKRKLEDNTYFCEEEFASDVRLTFSSAIHYNPFGSYVKELNVIEIIEEKIEVRVKESQTVMWCR